jgi:hypothetical protein
MIDVSVKIETQRDGKRRKDGKLSKKRLRTEPELQKDLTPLWWEEGLKIDEKHLFLAAWEVMLPSWKINDGKIHFGEPAMDFLFLDINGMAYILELKPEVSANMGIWLALAQTTYFSTYFRNTASYKNLDSIHTQANSGRFNRIGDLTRRGNSVQIAHQNFFGISNPLHVNSFLKGPIYRVLAAFRFGPGYEKTVEKFEYAQKLPVEFDTAEKFILVELKQTAGNFEEG